MKETLHCQKCGGDCPTDARFCIDCGATLAPAATGATTRLPGMRCPGCGTSNPEHARFCVVCGRGLQAGAVAPKRLAPPQPPVSSAPRPIQQHSYPRVATPPAPIQAPPSYAPRRKSSRLPGIGWPLFAALAFVMLVTHTFWPGILVLIGFGNYISAESRGQHDRALTALFWWGGLALLFALNIFWPGIIVLIVLGKVLSHRGHSLGW